MDMRFANRFNGKVALLTGSAAANPDELMGFGGATVWRFFEEGGRGVVITDIQDEIGERSAQQLRDSGHDAIYMHLDVTEEEEWTNVVAATMKHFGRLDILVNIAGILDPKSILDIEPAVWKKTMEISTVGVFLGTRAVARAMDQSGGGAIINLASMAAKQGSGSYGSAYSYSRGGMLNFSMSAALQLSGMGIRVNTIMPGWIHTPFTDYLYTDPEQSKFRTDRVPLGRWGKPEDIAGGILFIASDDASYITGAELLMDGGVSAGSVRPPNPKGDE
ncbi:MAG: SDR family oxidoreductase [Dehalococcoidia bacterium]|jgi:NAD(P)-dependent dehydrogenase (short-subunit alcohol dehydrogenase family)|nr:SDR family oxidoreductase [Dehalococcoidia bacterium]MDP7089878.1 SDR family oxidoreductase [Dehalococcoidia bacterium]MDP7262669.1 SDR family oxidoreductase [Dehalococcoidia bacterium]MDP7485189.1 SDR family oxidoreductase [Dehalococcoidia bacterium]|tara:strand:- start:201 stop:1028 length:828 start_codon:yes stop_codon:yes gene_type:complete